MRHHVINGVRRHLGAWHRDRPDHRDDAHTQKLLTILKPMVLPPAFDGSSVTPPIRDQGAYGSCSGHAWRNVWMADALRAGRTTETDRSPLFIYDMERRIDGVPLTEDSGAQIRDGAKALLFYGAASELAWPYDETRFDVMPSHAAFVDAAAHKIITYYRLPNLDAVKRSIASRYPVVFGFTCFASLESDLVSMTGQIPYPGPGEQSIGGHALACDSFDDNLMISGERGAVLGPNSWGIDWGHKGRFALPYRYFTDGLAADFWTLRIVAL